MIYSTHCKSIIRAEFFKPLFEFFDTEKHRRNRPALDDPLWLEAGVRRCLGIFQSGRDFLQQLADQHDTRVLISTFSESLKSKRRLLLVDEILGHVRSRMRRELPDPFACYKCLDDFDIHDGDGHFIAAASHDKAKPRLIKSPAPPTPPGPSSSANGGLLAEASTSSSTKPTPSASGAKSCWNTMAATSPSANEPPSHQPAASNEMNRNRD